jgi:lysophospholipase L1-like esterase
VSATALLVVALTAAALVAEALVRVVWSPRHPRAPFVRTGFDPDLGLVHLTGRHVLTFRRCLAGAEHCEDVPVRFTINNHGQRGVRDARDPPGRPLVVLLGDSMIEGAQVDDEDTSAHVLERRLQARFPDAEVRNLGITSAGLVHYHLRARRLLAATSPSVLVVAVLGLNDFRNSSSRLETLEPMRPRYTMSAAGREVHFGRPSPRPASLLDRWETARLLRWIASREGPRAGFFPDAAIYEDPPTPEMAEAIGLGTEYLERTVTEARARGARVLVASLPWRGECLDEEWAALARRHSGSARLARERPDDLVREAALRAGARFVSLRAAMARVPREDLARLWHRGEDAHFTAEGHRFLAAILETEVVPLIVGDAPPKAR